MNPYGNGRTRRRSRAAIGALVITLLLAGGGPIVSQAPAEGLQRVLIVSIDALHPAALGAAGTPAIHRLMRQGVADLDGRSTDPPQTLIAHAAMFTGMGPGEGGRTDNRWRPGDPTVSRPTIFDLAKARGYSTGYFYSKPKLGFLVNDAVDEHRLSPQAAVGLAEVFSGRPGRRFVFLHVGGLDEVGPAHGWLSPEYREELFYIDEELAPLLEAVKSAGNHLIIVTSDHGGHGRRHGCRHPDDFRLPVVIQSDRLDVESLLPSPYRVSDLKGLLSEALQQGARRKAGN